MKQKAAKKLFAPSIALAGLLAIATPAQAAGENFGPWNGNVKVGDALLPSPKTHTERRQVYGGAEAGAFIMIRLFQTVVSPQDGPACRYHPVCSAYGKLSVERFGALLGSLLAGDRLLRCNPFNPPGEDPVPIRLGDD